MKFKWIFQAIYAEGNYIWVHSNFVFLSELLLSLFRPTIYQFRFLLGAAGRGTRRLDFWSSALALPESTGTFRQISRRFSVLPYNRGAVVSSFIREFSQQLLFLFLGTRRAGRIFQLIQVHLWFYFALAIFANVRRTYYFKIDLLKNRAYYSIPYIISCGMRISLSAWLGFVVQSSGCAPILNLRILSPLALLPALGLS